LLAPVGHVLQGDLQGGLEVAPALRPAAEAGPEDGAEYAPHVEAHVAEVRPAEDVLLGVALVEPGVPELVVGLPLLGVAEDRVGLADLLEALLGPRLPVAVGVVLERQPAVRLLHVLGAGVAGDAQQLVVVGLGRHRRAPEAEGARSRAVDASERGHSLEPSPSSPPPLGPPGLPGVRGPAGGPPRGGAGPRPRGLRDPRPVVLRRRAGAPRGPHPHGGPRATPLAPVAGGRRPRRGRRAGARGQRAAPVHAPRHGGAPPPRAGRILRLRLLGPRRRGGPPPRVPLRGLPRGRQRLSRGERHRQQIPGRRLDPRAGGPPRGARIRPRRRHARPLPRHLRHRTPPLRPLHAMQPDALSMRRQGSPFSEPPAMRAPWASSRASSPSWASSSSRWWASPPTSTSPTTPRRPPSPARA